DVVSASNEKFQLVGLAKKYLGRWGEFCMAVVMYSVLFGVLVVYMIGVGEILARFFGGEVFNWSVGFFCLGILLIYIGIRTVKVIELFLTFLILGIVLVLTLLSVPYMQFPQITYVDLSQFLLPYGVILFAFHGTTAVPEVYSILSHKKEGFKHALLFGGMSTMVLYVLFSLVVVGVTGIGTTEIATFGLGEVVGQRVFLFGNVFALLAMSTAFLMTGLSLRDSFCWDYKIKTFPATALVAIVPLIIYIGGLRSFMDAIDLVGGVFISLEVFLLLLIYWKAKVKGHIHGRSIVKHGWFFVALIAFAVAIGTFYNIMNLF
ncbi:MAG: aromatic amino acid transport family protein, partial [Candidatus Magasanikbacteria bacterium]